MPSHLWRVLGLGRARIDLVFHPPLTITAFGSRKALADHCFAAVRDGVLQALSGALPPPPAGPSA
jgi:1-acyl-sn-glycerol-3-phosphate acyltransferase